MRSRKVSVVLATSVAIALAAAQNPSPQASTTDILQYIDQTWKVLRRSNRTLPTAAVDPKFHPDPQGRWPVYIPRTEDVTKVEAQLKSEISEAGLKTIAIRPLPVDINAITEPGLLYLPKPYVVPGGRFNEMYGWDSYFIQVGLLRDRRSGSCQGHGGQFSVPGEELWRQGAQRESDLLSESLAAPFSNANDAWAFMGRLTTRTILRRLCRKSSSITGCGLLSHT